MNNLTKLQKESKHYHHEDKGCELIEARMLTNRVQSEKEEYLPCLYCETHKVYCCKKDGWEFGWHQGINSRKLKK